MPSLGFKYSGPSGNHHVGSHVRNHLNVRKYTDLLLERIEEGKLDKDNVIMACVKYMSESDVQDMMEHNEFCEPDELE